LIDTYILEFQNGGKNGRIVLVWWQPIRQLGRKCWNYINKNLI